MVADGLLYSQPRDYSVVRLPQCPQEPWEVARAPECYVPARLNLWRPVLGYENVQCIPLPSQPVTNASNDPCYIPRGMVTEPMRFPNQVSGFERNPAHAARAALYPRYTKYEWEQNNVSLYSEADTNRNFSERLRAESMRLVLEKDETRGGDLQQDVTNDLNQRVATLEYWRGESNKEFDLMVEEIKRMQEHRRAVEKAIQDIEGPIHIAQECLHHRESRTGIDLVRDEPEESLMKELSIYRVSQEKLGCILQKADEQQENNRACLHDLERDSKTKEEAIRIDKSAELLHNCSRDLKYLAGIEEYVPTLTTLEEWLDNTRKTIQRSQLERHKSAQLRCEMMKSVKAFANDIWSAWDQTNVDLQGDFQTGEAKKKMEFHLRKVLDELFQVEKYMELLRKAIQDKARPMKVAHTRLYIRSCRRDVEMAKDEAHMKLIKEVETIKCSIEELHRKLEECEAKRSQLITTRSNLETNLLIKANTLFMDREKCLTMRRSFPIRSMICYPFQYEC